MSQLTFAVVAFVITPATVPDEPMLALAFGVAALAVVVVSFVLPRRMLTMGLRQLELEVTESVAEQPDRFGGFYRNAAAKQRLFANPKQALARAFLAFQTPFILGLALSEAVTLFGLTLAVLGFAPPLCVPFFVVGALLVAIRFPTLAALQRAVEQAYGASLGPTGD
jgi:hypothetical protein